MKDVKMPTSISYRDLSIERLKDPQHAAGFIEAILEEKDPEPELLRNALRKVIEARARVNELSESAHGYYDKLDQMLTDSGAVEIYSFVELLEALGFGLAVIVKE